jgi:pyruvate,orthophosphate dikinase
VVITRNLHTTQFSISGDYKKNAQGHDLVASYVTQDSICPIEGMRATHPKLFHELESVADKVDAYFNAPQDMELTVEQGSLWVLQTRTEAYIRQDFPGLDRGDSKPLADGVGVSGGAYRGIVGFLSSDFDLLRKRVKETNSKAGRQVVDGIILLIHSPSTADVPFMLDNAGGWVTQLGGRTSHAALIANQHDISAVFGMTSLVVDEKNHRATIDARRAKKKGVEIKEGDICSIEGHATGGQLFRGSLPLTSKKEGDLLPV